MAKDYLCTNFQLNRSIFENRDIAPLKCPNQFFEQIKALMLPQVLNRNLPRVSIQVVRTTFFQQYVNTLVLELQLVILLSLSSSLYITGSQEACFEHYHGIPSWRSRSNFSFLGLFFIAKGMILILLKACFLDILYIKYGVAKRECKKLVSNYGCSSPPPIYI